MTMDYKYIENLIERYFSCQTNVQEEKILKDFFMLQNIPASLEQYRPLFDTLASEERVELPSDFDDRLMKRIKRTENAGKKVIGLQWFDRMNHTLSPFYKAVASVALVITVGVASSTYWNSQDPEPVNYNYSRYHDTYSDPQVAYQQVSGALRDLSEVFKNDSTVRVDTLTK